MSSPRYRVPDELREALLDFTIAYLTERPPSLTEFGVHFFSARRGQQQGVQVGQQQQSFNGRDGEADDAPPPPRPTTRRKSVFAEAYNPEEDEDTSPNIVHPKSDGQRARLAEAVKHILLFRSLDLEQMQEVIDAMFERRVQPGENVIVQGDDGDNFYVIESGTYRVYVQPDPGAPPRAVFDEAPSPRLVFAYEGSGSFGELALMYNMPRAATIQAESEGSLWAMDRQTFRRIVLKNAFRKRQMYEQLLNAVPMLKTLESYERMNLADALVPRSFPDGETIIRQGEAGDGMYFVEEGVIRISRVENGKESELTRITKGGYFGELALLTNQPRAATAYAVGGSKCAFLDVEAFERLLGPCMELMKRSVVDYEKQLIQLFGSKSNITDIR